MDLLLAYWHAGRVAYTVAAADGGSPVPDAATWSQYGPATVSASIFAAIAWYLFGMQRDTLRIEREGRASAEAEVRELNKQLREQVVPVLTQFTSEAAKLTQVTAEVTRVLQSWRDRERR
jgi:hypothetical protein